MTHTTRCWITSLLLFTQVGTFAIAHEPSREPAAGALTFMLLLYDDRGPNPNETAAEHAAVVREYSTWAQQLAAEGKVKDGAEVRSRGGKVLRATGSAVTIEERTVATGVDGYFLIRARDYDEAVAIAKTCPHLRFGGWIEVRQVVE